jgi:hypothetical protein
LYHHRKRPGNKKWWNKCKPKRQGTRARQRHDDTQFQHMKPKKWNNNILEYYFQSNRFSTITKALKEME